MSRTKQIEEKHNVILNRINYDGFITYEIFHNGCEVSQGKWLLTLNEVDEYLKEYFNEVNNENNN